MVSGTAQKDGKSRDGDVEAGDKSRKIICTSEPKGKAKPIEAEQMISVLPQTMALLPGLFTLALLVSFF